MLEIGDPGVIALADEFNINGTPSRSLSGGRDRARQDGSSPSQT